MNCAITIEFSAALDIDGGELYIQQKLPKLLSFWTHMIGEIFFCLFRIR